MRAKCLHISKSKKNTLAQAAHILGNSAEVDELEEENEQLREVIHDTFEEDENLLGVILHPEKNEIMDKH